MNYERLKELLRTKKWSIDKACAKIGKSTSWFHSAVKNDTMTIADLEKLLKLCKSSLEEFFGNQPNYSAQEPTVSESTWMSEKMELLEENRQLRLRLDKFEGKGATPEAHKPKSYR